MLQKTVLIIEDNPLNMKLVRSLLVLGGYTTLEAVNAEQGIEFAREHRPDMILMDIQLPGIDGLTATRQIKDDPQLHAIPVIALTSYAMKGDEKRIKDAGCDGYIAKPLDTRNFLSIIAGYIDD